MMTNRRIPARTPITSGVLSPSMRAAMTPLLKGGGSATVRTDRGSIMGTRIIPARAPLTAGIGGTALRLPAGRSPVPTSTLAPASVFGGANGGMGPSGAAIPPTTLSAIGSSFSKASVGVINTVGTFVPLAIKVILVIIVIKIVLWLIKGRRR